MCRTNKYGVTTQTLSLQIDIVQMPNSPTISLNVDMIHTSHTDFPSLTFMEEPHSKTIGHYFLDDSLDQ